MFWEETKSEKNYLNSTYGRRVVSCYLKSGKSKFRISKRKNCCLENVCPLILLYNSIEWGYDLW